jgi:hypothetical protein
MSALLSHTGKTFAAVHGTVGLGLERNLSLASTSRANSRKILAGAAGSSLAGITAGFAALGLILEASLCIELLLAGSKHELLAAFLTH